MCAHRGQQTPSVEMFLGPSLTVAVLFLLHITTSISGYRIQIIHPILISSLLSIYLFFYFYPQLKRNQKTKKPHCC